METHMPQLIPALWALEVLGGTLNFHFVNASFYVDINVKFTEHIIKLPLIQAKDTFQAVSTTDTMASRISQWIPGHWLGNVKTEFYWFVYILIRAVEIND